MSTDIAASDRRDRIIILSAIFFVAVVGALSWFDAANSATEPSTTVTEPPTIIATSCSGFESDAHQMFDKSGNTALRGTFAPGDRVHLAIDLRGAGLSWEATGVLGEGPHVMPSFWYALFRTTKLHTHTTTTHTLARASRPESTTIVSNGTIDGYARWEMDVDVATAGEGAITVNQTSIVPPKIAIASCTPRKGAAVT
jgi:hypothetical protein